jgi:ubiquinone/menaquinone biosynthesis C-methylase UbiE
VVLSTNDWHDRFLVQAQWSRDLRGYFFQSLKSTPADRILDIGCGTGALFTDFISSGAGTVFGADINIKSLIFSHHLNQEVFHTGADVHRLPFPDASFDLVICHYFLMWTGNPISALGEMKRITRPGGVIAAFAEPDYGGRIDHPAEFNLIRDLQINALLQAGADPMMGRRIKSLFSGAGLRDLEWGVYQGSWNEVASDKEVRSEWSVLREDLKDQLTRIEIDALEKHDQRSRKAGTRLVYVPTFYCWGYVN